MSVWLDSPFSSLMEDCMSCLDSPFLMADPSLVNADLEAGPVKSCLTPHQFGGNEGSELSSQCPCIDPLDTDNVDAFTGLDWMVEKVDLFDTETGCPSPDLLAALDGSNLLEELPFEPLPVKQVADLSLDLESFPNSPKGLDQLAPGTPTVVPESIFFDDPLHVEVERVIDIPDVEEKLDTVLIQSPLQDSCTEMLDSDSGLGSSPPHSPDESLDRSVSERSSEDKSFLNNFSPARSKPYDRPSVETVGCSPKLKGNCLEPKSMEKKLKKMEQNKSAATRYRQKKRAEQGAIVAECTLLEEKNKTLQEKADSLTKEIQYLKSLIEDVRKAKNKKLVK
ncbi:cyclic AMP-dependent transcription factor ATF-4-like [Hemitrygon akajei]|uniref:cyclic AMP-dependent transcription factor ATF-4-like n=1 Tax=Hemitrygon akajei TaxID=2704970 RepID=UPI003BFA1803